MDYKKMSFDQLLDLKYILIARGSLNAASEVSDFMEFYGKQVRVIKGRKVKIGTTGKCFWIKRYDYSKYGDPWGIYSDTRIGIRTEDGNVEFTSSKNVEVIKEVEQ